ncbi:hypothetical protein CEN45_16315 [Fischerella thermalis CCMEE 5198]|jgi:hypothetical protein|uniref:hypothetical protein n=1 Tax=Fischerella thermalis TaxID=372787 RepID=UPI000C80F45F|nr:hypothetical protein [Fischerella thermalis]PLZ91227.1 hypothetical protein CI594_18295 [Fischerella thermalis CCMEE 5196]PMB20754.1 hypothetical protein CEN45_16315 [Fischerella thermalis CCMEE 5198]PMB49991.1 hypothetical protein CEN39_19780 [Fischerella thermalis CCMEE 5201]
MVREIKNDRPSRFEKFLRHLGEARKLQDDILKYGLAAADLYCEDVDGDWLETWGDEENTFLESVVSFLESDDLVAVRVRKQLKDKSLPEIATELEKCLSFGEEEERIFALKNVLVGSVTSGSIYRDVSDDDEIDLLDLAEELLEKLTHICGEN